MGTLNVTRVAIKPFKNDMFYEIFELDGDFTTNDEYFRENIVAIGYRNEADRLSQEIVHEFNRAWDKDPDDDRLLGLVEYYIFEAIGRSTYFLLNNSTYCSEYAVEVIATDGLKEITAVLSYITK